MLIAFNLKHRFMHMGIEILTACGNRFNSVFFQATQELISHQFQPFPERIEIIGLGCRFQGPVQAVHNWKDIPKEIFISEIDEIGLFPGRPLFIIFKIGKCPQIIIIVFGYFFFLQLQLRFQRFSVLAGAGLTSAIF